VILRRPELVFALLLGVAAVAAPLPAHAAPGPDKADEAKEPTPAERERSRAAFRKGVVQLRAQDWAGARASFEEAWSLVQHPSILLNLGIARLRTDDPVLAEQDLVRFLSEDSGAEAAELATARDALTEARGKIGVLRVTATPESARARMRITVDGKPGGPSTKVKAGKHAVIVEAEGFTTERRDVDVPAKGDADLKLALVADKSNAPPAAAATEPAPSSGSPPATRTILGWSLAGVGGIALVTSGVLALEALGRSHDYEDETSKSFQSADVKSQGIAFRTGADVAFLAALLAGAGAYLLLFTKVGVPASRVPRATLHW
jgi:hypothetical protein